MNLRAIGDGRVLRIVSTKISTGRGSRKANDDDSALAREGKEGDWWSVASTCPCVYTLGPIRSHGRIGRSTTINGLGHKRKTEPWHEVDQKLEKTRLERRCLDPDEHILDPEPSSNKFFMSQLIKHNSEETGYWFSAKGSVYEASAFMHRHPGGDTMIALCSGQNVTDSLKAVGHFTNASIRNKMESYRIGSLENPKFASSHAEEVYMAAVDLGQKAAEMENVQRGNFQLLNGKLTILDEPETH
ncbi:hypothetical protein N7505_005233 [Penicillium chrysogenum]|uniref:Cytochrome b5 heme-binding domain-containing protein n=1 Tax=Penicillium chrysogenum TaxID=5076 RepID=A0ABQ8WIP2_PENCH|nr:hypothetical protein N7505_005233 [Penicillium chrysogenum]